MGPGHSMSPPLLPILNGLLHCIHSYRTPVEVDFRQLWMMVVLWFSCNFDMVMENESATWTNCIILTRNLLYPVFNQAAWFCFCWWVFEFSIYFLINVFSDIWSSNNFFHSIGCLFAQLIVFFYAQKFLTFIKSNSSNFGFVTCAFGVISEKLLPNVMFWSFLICFIWRVFIDFSSYI